MNSYSIPQAWERWEFFVAANLIRIFILSGARSAESNGIRMNKIHAPFVLAQQGPISRLRHLLIYYLSENAPMARTGSLPILRCAKYGKPLFPAI
jgi:hypothetical protein